MKRIDKKKARALMVLTILITIILLIPGKYLFAPEEGRYKIELGYQYLYAHTDMNQNPIEYAYTNNAYLIRMFTDIDSTWETHYHLNGVMSSKDEDGL